VTIGNCSPVKYGDVNGIGSSLKRIGDILTEREFEEFPNQAIFG
jgi:hypothetical protein